MLVLALTRLVEIVGEAASRVSEPTRVSIPEVPWAQLRGMRNRLVHAYDRVDEDILWSTIVDNFPPLIAQLAAAIESEERRPRG